MVRPAVPTARHAAEATTLHELLTSGDRFEAMFRAEPDCVKLLDEQGRLLDMNPAGLAMIGAGSLDEVRGCCVADLVAEPDRERFNQLNADAFQGRTGELEFDLVPHAGEPRRLQTRVVPLWNGDAVAAVLSITRDTTERRAAEEKLRRSEERYRLLMQMASDGIFVAAPEGRYTLVNEAACRITGYSADELIGMHLEQLMDPEELTERPSRHQQIAIGRTLRSVRRLRRKDGAVLLVDIAGTRLPDGSLYGIVRDITEQERDRELARRRATLLAEAERLAQVGAWEWRAGSPTIELSDELARLLGAQPGEPFLRSNFSRYVHPEDVAEREAAAMRALQTGQGYESRFRVIRDTGEVRYCRGRTEVEWDGSRNEAVRMFGVIQDVTDMVRLEQQLLHTQKLDAVGQLAGGIAHDFNNLLTAILGYTELALGAVPPTESVRDDLEQVRATVDRAVALTRQLLAFSRKQATQPRRFDFRDVVTGLEPMLGRLLGERIDFEVRVPESACAVLADRNQMEQVVVNLAVNARDAMPDGGKLLLLVSCESASEGAPSDVVLTVADSGPGIPKAILDRVFEPFFTTKPPGQGTGLGLSVVYGIVTEAGGTVSIDSTDNRGTIVTVRLPQVAFAEGGLPEVTPILQAESGTVLLVEDDGAVREVSRRLVARLGYDVVPFASGNEALQWYETHGAPDAVITDIALPGITGTQLARQLLERGFRGRLVLVSGYPADELSKHADLVSRVTVLQKPWQLPEMAQGLRALDK